MSSRRGNMNSDPFEREPLSLERLDSELFGDLERVGRPVVLNLDEIRRDGGTQPRAELDHELIAEYAEAIQRDAVFPPVDVFYDGANYWLADGFHRWHGHEQAGKSTIRATIHQGTQRDAVLFSVGVNAEHGKRRTNEDKKRAVMVLLSDPGWSQWSDREIARRAKVHHQMVGRLRESLDESSSERTYVTKHGTQATMKTDGIREANQERATQPWRTDGPERTSSADEPAGQYGDEFAPAWNEDPPSGVSFETPAEPIERYEQDDQAIGEQVPVLAALQDFIGLAIDLARKLENMQRSGAVVPEELKAGFHDQLADALDYCTGYENPRGEWVPGVVELLEWAIEDVR